MHSNTRRVAAIAVLAVVLSGSLAGCRVAYTDAPSGAPAPIATPVPIPSTTTEPTPTQAPPTQAAPGSYSAPFALDGNVTLNFETLLAETGGEVYFLASDRSATISLTANSMLSIGEYSGLTAVKTDLGYDLTLNSDDGWAFIGNPETGDFLELFIESEGY